MAEAIGAVGAVAGVAAMAQSAFEASIKLYQLVKSFQSHNSRVKELELELGAFCEILRALGQHVEATKADASTLRIPLQQCANVCAAFSKEVAKCSAHSDGTRTSFRDWAKLRYMGDDIDGFRRLIASYKMTMTVALNDLNLQASAETAESIENYHELIETTQEDLRERMQGMDEKLDRLLTSQDALDEADVQEVRLIQDERLSTEKCLQICAELSHHIIKLQHTARQNPSAEDEPASQIPRKIYNDGLQECVNSLTRTAGKLASFENDLFERLMEKTATATASDEDRATLSQLQDQLRATRESMAVCVKANEHLREEVATIENYATGDAIQLMVSINNKPIHGKNRGMGWRTRQLGGYVDKDNVRDAIKHFSTVSYPVIRPDDASAPESGPGAANESAASKTHTSFNGAGYSLGSRPV